MLTSKSVELLKFLLSRREKVLLKELAEHFELSERSIRYEAEKIIEETGRQKIIIEKYMALGNK